MNPFAHDKEEYPSVDLENFDEGAAPEPEEATEDSAALEAAAAAFGNDNEHAARIAALEEETALLKDAVLRARAETENIRKRSQKEIEEAGKYGVTGFARDLVNIIENLQRAADSIPEEAKAENELLNTIAMGVNMTREEFLSVLSRHGVRRIDPLGEKFDHNFHQAVTQIPTADAEPGTVVQVVQAGYVIHDRLLTPAMVCVAKQPENPAPPIESIDTQA